MLTLSKQFSLERLFVNVCICTHCALCSLRFYVTIFVLFWVLLYSVYGDDFVSLLSLFFYLFLLFLYLSQFYFILYLWIQMKFPSWKTFTLFGCSCTQHKFVIVTFDSLVFTLIHHSCMLLLLLLGDILVSALFNYCCFLFGLYLSFSCLRVVFKSCI